MLLMLLLLPPRIAQKAADANLIGRCAVRRARLAELTDSELAGLRSLALAFNEGVC